MVLEDMLSNLSILECKFHQSVLTIRNLKHFQIYPYWNVNVGIAMLPLNVTCFQIYPYWNVNLYHSRQLRHEVTLSNLSILECKYIFVALGKAAIDAFQIYPYWNVNLN